MELCTFYDNIEADESLTGVGVDSSDENNICVIVKHTMSGLTTKMPIDRIDDHEYEFLLSILVGEREPIVLQHMTRVVGYFSRVDNWNTSKLGELKDRQKGAYVIG